nr:uncharacterized protein LOC118971562 [Manis javanica]
MSCSFRPPIPGLCPAASSSLGRRLREARWPRSLDLPPRVDAATAAHRLQGVGRGPPRDGAETGAVGPSGTFRCWCDGDRGFAARTVKLWLQAVFTARLSVTSVGTGNREAPCVKPAAGASACLGLAGQRGHSCFRLDGTSLDVEQRIIYSKCAPTCAATDLSLWRSPCGASPVLDTLVQGLWPGPVRAPHHEPRGQFCTPIVRGQPGGSQQSEHSRRGEFGACSLTGEAREEVKGSTWPLWLRTRRPTVCSAQLEVWEPSRRRLRRALGPGSGSAGTEAMTDWRCLLWAREGGGLLEHRERRGARRGQCGAGHSDEGHKGRALAAYLTPTGWQVMVAATSGWLTVAA